MVIRNGAQLPLERCPHCSVSKPVLVQQWSGKTVSNSENLKRDWFAYACTSCGGMVLGMSHVGLDGILSAHWPSTRSASQALPERAREYIQQSMASIHAPSGAVMLAASAVDAMLKAKGLVSGSLYSRIDTAASNHLITKEMAEWAHAVRLDANNERHADIDAPLPTHADADRVISFAEALGQFLFELPAVVARGKADAAGG